jgi:hypothetical protein
MRSLVLGLMLAASSALAYQVTGPVLEINGDKIVVQKGKEKWEVSKGAAQVTGGELKVGAKVTIEYTMTATSIEVKAEKKGDDKKGEKKKGEKAEKPDGK